jgi:dihydropteroate synthase
MTLLTTNLTAIDSELSNREIALDPNGYFIIYVDRADGLICAKHYTNVINDRGLAVDPETGKVIPANRKVDRTNTTLYVGRTAKELCVKILETTQPSPVSMLDHAAYLGREFVRAEMALLSSAEYIQD